MVSKTVPRPANRCSRRSSRRNRSSRLAASFLAVSIAQIAPAAAQLEASRRPCAGASKPTPATGAHLQLSWDSCDYAQNPLDPYWIDPNTAPGARPARRSLAPGTTGKDCDSFPFVHGELHLPSKCISPSAWVSVPDRGIRKLSCNRLRYFPDLLKLLFPERELYGHANLSVVALSGKIQFLEKASPDQDYNFALFPNGAGAPLTDQNPKVDGRAFVSLEFFAPESVDTFQGPWWRGLEEAVRLGRSEDPHWTSARRYVGDVDGYAVGLFGLDCQ